MGKKIKFPIKLRLYNLHLVWIILSCKSLLNKSVLITFHPIYFIEIPDNNMTESSLDNGNVPEFVNENNIDLEKMLSETGRKVPQCILNLIAYCFDKLYFKK